MVQQLYVAMLELLGIPPGQWPSPFRDLGRGEMSPEVLARVRRIAEAGVS
jgi:hypothetical protein